MSDKGFTHPDGNGGRTRFAKVEPPSGEPHHLWTRTLETVVDCLLTSGRFAVTTAADQIFIIDLAEGEVRHFLPGGRAVLVDETALLLPVNEPELWGVDLDTGDATWALDLETVPREYAVVGKTLVVAFPKALAAFDLADPRKAPRPRWRKAMEIPKDPTLVVTATLAAVRSRWGSSQGFLLSDGSPAWEGPLRAVRCGDEDFLACDNGSLSGPDGRWVVEEADPRKSWVALTSHGLLFTKTEPMESGEREQLDVCLAKRDAPSSSEEILNYSGKRTVFTGAVAGSTLFLACLFDEGPIVYGVELTGARNRWSLQVAARHVAPADRRLVLALGNMVSCFGDLRGPVTSS